MTQINHQPCPCSDSSDAYSYNTEKGVGYCHSCSKTFQLNKKESNTITYEFVDEYTPVRGLTNSTLRYYGVKDAYDMKGEKVGHVYPYTQGYKLRVFPKTFTAGDGLRSDTLFGINKFNAGGPAVLITEGEMDAMSAYQMLNTQVPCVSLPSATPSHRLWQNEKVVSWLNSFEKIYCSFDSDGKSDHILNKLATLFPNKVFRLLHTKYKDANEFLQAGAKDAYYQCKNNARKYVPANTWNSPQDFLEILDEDSTDSSIPTGIVELDERIEGLMKGKLTVFQAPEGTGKTELLRYFEWNILKNHPTVPIAVMHLEESNQRALLGIASYALKTNVTRKPSIPEELWPEVKRVISEVAERGNFWLFNMGESDDPKEILDKIRYLAVGCGVEYIFFEPIQDLAYFRQDDSSVEQFLSNLATRLATLARELNIGIITVAHENDNGETRDSRMISKRAAVVIKLERELLSPDEVTRNTTKLLIKKNRPAAYTGYGGALMFDAESFTLEEILS